MKINKKIVYCKFIYKKYLKIEKKVLYYKRNLGVGKVGNKKNEEKKKTKSTKTTRTKKNKRLYGQKTVIKNKKTSNIIIILLIISLIVNGLSIVHFIKFDHNKVKIVTKIKEKEIKPENIVFIGDSITDFYDLGKYYPNKNIINSGINGYTTDDLYSKLNKLLYQYKPTKIFLLIGINNIIRGQNSDKVYNGIKNIIEEIKKNLPETEINVESIYPTNDSDEEKIFGEYVEKNFNKKVIEVNKKTKEYCEKEKINYIDVYSSLLDKNQLLKLEYTADGVHLTDLGYSKVTSILLPYIKEKNNA